MTERQYLTRAVVLGGIIGLAIAAFLWFGFGSALFSALDDLFTPVALLVWVLPPFVAGVFAGAIRRTDRSDEVVTAGMAAGGLTGLGVLLFLVLPDLLRAPFAAMEWLVATLVDQSMPAVETLVVDGFVFLEGAIIWLGRAIIGLGIAVVFVATLAAIPGLVGGLMAYGLRIHLGPESGLAQTGDASS